MTTAIKIEGLSKKYIIGHKRQERYTALRDVIMHKLRGVGERLRHPLSLNREEIDVEEFWALKDINLEIKQGDRVGIIGRNGAGKSTLLKILSRITEPTSGKIHINGRVSSLLEVGTGFHPELSGRENIYLNGAIFGMNRIEIREKFDEIVDFSGVEKFLDTPVKRYSSGMYVRLAFAVAAHLEPDILIIDEVLAVGDAKFQKKCLGKMEEVGKRGRTVLFVSHNMATVTSLCDKAILLEGGKIIKAGTTSEVVMHYFTSGQQSPSRADFSRKHVGDDSVRLLTGEIRNSKGDVSLEANIDELISIQMQFEVLREGGFPFVPNFYMYNTEGVCLFVTASDENRIYKKGVYVSSCNIPGNLLNEGAYFVGLAGTTFDSGVLVHFFERDALSFNVRDTMADMSTRAEWVGPMPGVIRPKLFWKTREL